MGFYIQLWEIALLIIAAAIVVVAVFLVKSLKNFNTTISRVNKLLEENENQLNNIIKNSEQAISNTADLTGTAKVGIQKVDSIISGASQPKSIGANAANAIINYSKYGFAAISIISGIINYRRRKKRKYK
ncbi:MAG: DUF948 domain-containing protein [Eubacteriaceae bacterium]